MFNEFNDLFLMMSMESKSEMVEYLKAENDSYLIVGEDARSLTGIYVLKIHIRNESNYNIGIISDTNIEPQCKIINNTVILGFNGEVDCIYGKTIKQKYKYDSLFWSFIDFNCEEQILIALFELQIIGINRDGSLKWFYSTPEMITDFEVIEDKIRLVLETHTEIISLESGRRIYND